MCTVASTRWMVRPRADRVDGDVAFLHGKATEDVEADPAEHHARIRLPVNEAFDDVNDEAAERAEVCC